MAMEMFIVLEVLLVQLVKQTVVEIATFLLQK
jgi:hypothetical protein